jgi:hypothetical protein
MSDRQIELVREVPTDRVETKPHDEVIHPSGKRLLLPFLRGRLRRRRLATLGLGSAAVGVEHVLLLAAQEMGR